MTASKATPAAPSADVALFSLVADLEKSRAAYKDLAAERDSKLAELPPEAGWRWGPAFVGFKGLHNSAMERFDYLSRGPGCIGPERKAFDALWAHLSAFYEAKIAEVKRLCDEAGIDDFERRMDRISDESCGLISRICHMKPETLTGAIVLLREAGKYDDPDPDADADTVARVSALATLERLADGGRL